MNRSELVAMRMANNAERKAIMLATPCLSGFTPEYTRSREAAISVLNELGFKVSLGYVLGDSLLTHARNACVQQFLQSDADYLMFVDSDIGFDPLAIPTLLRANKDVVCGAAPQKRINWAQVRAAVLKGEQDLEAWSGTFVMNAAGPVVATSENPLIEVLNAGTGFMLIKRCVFDKMELTAPRYMQADGVVSVFFDEGVDDAGGYLSEDFHFCYKWRKLGGEVFVDPYVRLTHTGSYTFRGDITKGTLS